MPAIAQEESVVTAEVILAVEAAERSARRNDVGVLSQATGRCSNLTVEQDLSKDSQKGVRLVKVAHKEHQCFILRED
jgi:hypothetical protein